LEADGVQVRLGVKAKRIDRARQNVVLSDGTTEHYDRLVFATGSRPVIPNLTGLNPDPSRPVLPDGVTALRDLKDAAVLRTAVAGGKRVVVLGGGVLGLETALAASEEGAKATVVHNGPFPLGRSIDRGSGSVLTNRLRAPVGHSRPCCWMTVQRSTAICWCCPVASAPVSNWPRAAAFLPAPASS